MNISFIITMLFNPQQGGVQQSTYKLAKLMQERGHITNVIAFSNGKDCMVDDIAIHYVGPKIRPSSKLKKLLVEEKIHICINQMGYNTKLTSLLRVEGPTSMKLINTLRINPLNFIQNSTIFIKELLMKKGLGFISPNFVKKPILLYHKLKQRKSYKIILKKVDALVFLSPSFIKELDYFNVEREAYKNKLFAIPNPFSIQINPSNLKDKKNVILFVGRLNILQKRVDILLDIWKALHTQLPDWEFWVVGDGPERKNMEKFAKSNKLNRIKFFGYDDPTNYYKKAKILHFTSAFEGFGNVLVEAQREGVVPVLFNSYGAAVDIVEDKRNGILIQPFEVDLFIEESLHLINTPYLIEKMAENAIVDSRKFSYENISNLWFSLFEKISVN